MDVTERFWWHVLVGNENECWPWLAGKSPGGYGHFSFQGQTVQAHRFAYLLVHGLLLDGLVVMHRCDNPTCVNPAHLQLGTQADNVADMVAKNRHRREIAPKRNKPIEELQVHWKVGAPRRRVCTSRITM